MLIPEKYSKTKENLCYREEYKNKAREDIQGVPGGMDKPSGECFLC